MTLFQRTLSVSCSIIFVLFLPNAVVGQSCETAQLSVPVDLEFDSTAVTEANLPGCSGGGLTLEAIESPHHGHAFQVQNEIHYFPEVDFWSLRSDSLIYRFRCAADPLTIRWGIVHWVARLPALPRLRDEFEISPLYCGWSVNDPQGKLSLGEQQPGTGNRWLQVGEGASQPAFLSLVAEETSPGCFEWPESCRVLPETGSGEGESCIKTGTVDPCFCMIVDGNASLDEDYTVLNAHFSRATPGPPPPPVEIRLGGDGSGPARIQARASDGSGGECATDWADLGNHNTAVRLDLWNREAEEGSGLLLRVDDRAVGLLRCVDPELDGLIKVELGLVEEPGASGPRLDFDDLLISDRQPDWIPPQKRIDTFECGDLGDWNTAGQWSLEVSGDAALTGAWGIRVDLGAIATSSPRYGFLHDQVLPAGQRTFNLRFRLDTNTTGLVNGNSVILAGASSSTAPHGSEHLRLKLRGIGGGYELRAEAKDDAGTFQSTPWAILGTGAHTVELQWRAASGDSADDGLARLWIDGQLRAEEAGIDNHGWEVKGFRIGGIWPPSNALGVLYLDDIETWD